MTIASRGREALCVCVMCVFERESDGDGGTRNLGKDGEVHGERAAGEEVDA